MSWAKTTNITSWSFSRYKAYVDCPFKAKLKFIDKLREPSDPNGPMARGDKIHKMADAFIKGELKKMPAELSIGQFAAFFKMIKTLYKKKRELVSIEETWALRKDWSITTWNDWAGCWVRIKLDLCWVQDGVASIVDHKTGKFSPQYNLEDYMLQLDLYALGALIVHADVGPELKVIPRLHFLDQDIIYPPPGEEKIYTPKDLARLKKEWEKRVKPMLADTKFAPRPNQWCGRCHFRAANKANGGGQCKM